MEPYSIARTSHLERLPPELIHAILCQLSGLPTLRCAILSCRFILNSFTGSSSSIATRVFLNELDSCDVRPEAIAALLASRLVNPTQSSAHDFFQAHLQRRNVEVGIRLTLDEVADLSRLHSTVSRLVKVFTDTRLQKLIAIMKDDHTFQPQEPSTLERYRIMRTLYILEIFFNVFRQTSMPDPELGQCMNDFLLNFAPWEIEQIACVQEFLFFQVSPGFNEMTAHDVYWGAFRVRPAPWPNDPYVQSLFFKGLVSLESIAKAKTYDRLYELFDYGRIPDHRSRNLYKSLIGFTYKGYDERATVSDYENSRDYALRVKSPYFEEPDDGPFSAWKWAYWSASLRRSVYQWGQAKLCKWGYVMWDRARLDTLSIFRDTWPPPGFNPYRRCPPDDPWGVADGTWESSWEERSRIYKKQGRGWWNFGDESKIVWAPPKDPPEKDSHFTDVARRG
ncbi:hypothetical protein GGR51DRAFT_540579 [Nemania sp. FL0031]|nr:hypothetical protein GGR51DRAFT_540579 [Nemania sp. FL0031]